MIRRRNLSGERLELYSPIGLMPTDTFTGQAPLGRLQVMLDILDGGQWRETGIKEVRTPGGVIAYPGLGRSLDVAPQFEHRYRVRIQAEFYVPLYIKTVDGTLDGIEFDGFPYNDTNPPKNYPINPAGFPNYLKAVLKKLWLVPAPNYPFPDHVPVLRGVVVRSGTGEPVIGAEVIWGNKEMALTTEKGAFGLPMRVTEKKHITDLQKIDARDPRKNQQGTISVIVPKDVGINKTITVS